MELPTGQEVKTMAGESYDRLMPDISGMDRATYEIGWGGGWNEAIAKAMAIIDELEAENERLKDAYQQTEEARIELRQENQKIRIMLDDLND